LTLLRLDADKLLSEKGLPKFVANVKKIKFKGKGHEVENLDKLLAFYQIWGHELYPKLIFKSIVEKVEKVCKERRLKVFHAAIIQESRRRALDGWEEEEQQETVPMVLNEEEALDLDLELENAIRMHAMEQEMAELQKLENAEHPLQIQEQEEFLIQEQQQESDDEFPKKRRHNRILSDDE
jgi:hypothetical protein